MSTRLSIVLVLSVILVLLVTGMMLYLADLQNTPPATDLERQGRAKYLIDTRLPKLDIKKVFLGE